MCRTEAKTLRDTLTVLGACVAVPWVPWGIRALKEAMSRSISSGCAVRQTLRQSRPQPFMVSGPPGWFFWKLLSCQAKLYLEVTVFLPLQGTTHPSGSGAAFPHRDMQAPLLLFAAPTQPQPSVLCLPQCLSQPVQQQVSMESLPMSERMKEGTINS